MHQNLHHIELSALPNCSLDAKALHRRRLRQCIHYYILETCQAVSRPGPCLQVWDIRNNRCLQTLTDKQKHRPEDALTSLMYDSQQKQLLSGSVLPKVAQRFCLQVQLTTYTPRQSMYKLLKLTAACVMSSLHQTAHYAAAWGHYSMCTC